MGDGTPEQARGARTGWPWDDERYVLPPSTGPVPVVPVEVAAEADAVLLGDRAPAFEGHPEPDAAVPLDFEPAGVRRRVVARRTPERVPGFESSFWADIALEPHADEEPRADAGHLERRSRLRRRLGAGAVVLAVVLLAVAVRSWTMLGPDAGGPSGGSSAASTASTITLDGTAQPVTDIGCSSVGKVLTYQGRSPGGRVITASLDPNGSGTVVVERGGARLAAGHAAGRPLDATADPKGAEGAGDFVALDEDGRPDGGAVPGSFRLRCPA